MKIEHRKRLLKAAFGTTLIVAAGLIHANAPDFRRTTTARPSAAAEDSSSEYVLTTAGADRTELAIQLERSVRAAELSMKDARDALRSMDDDARKPFRKLEIELTAASSRVRNSLAATRAAGPEQWESALAQFAADYDAYVQLISQAQRAASATTRYGR